MIFRNFVLLQTADEEETGELDIETFKAKMAPHLGEDISDTELVQLFMKIDADCGGTVDWQALLACCEHLQNDAIDTCQRAAVTYLTAGLIDDMGFCFAIGRSSQITSSSAVQMLQTNKNGSSSLK